METNNKKTCGTCGKDLSGRQTKWCCGNCKNKQTNSKHQNYIAQQARGLKRKKELVEIMGGECKKCGYKSNYSALSFHHLNPETKIFSLDLRACSNNRWEVLIEEAEKCELLCLNCHAETHNPQLNT